MNIFNHNKRFSYLEFLLSISPYIDTAKYNFNGKGKTLNEIDRDFENASYLLGLRHYFKEVK